MVGARYERRPNQRGRAGDFPREREPLVDRPGPVRCARRDVREQLQDPPARERDRVRAQVVGGRVLRGGERERGLRAGHERRVARARGTARDPALDRSHCVERRTMGVARPQQRRDFGERRGACERGRVAASVVKPSVGDQRDRRLEDRQPPVQRLFGRYSRVAALLGSRAQALDVVAGIAAATRVAGRGFRTHASPAHVRIKRRAAHAEKRDRLFCVEPRGFDSTHVDH